MFAVPELLPLTPPVGRPGGSDALRLGPPIGAGLPETATGGGWSNGSARRPKPDETEMVSSGMRIEGGVAAWPLASQKRSVLSRLRKRWMETVPLALVRSSAHSTRPMPIGAPSAVKVCS